ncbi:MAG TPA: hypothetical protein VFG54_22940 [Prolixibacteraceae bacterium]|nr:hypothetical protein [Prolixibacteraceae bacterium]
MKFTLQFLFVLIYINSCFGQVFETICATEGGPSLKSGELIFIDINEEPIKHVRTNFIFLRKDDGTGGFQENNSDHQKYINDMINEVNNIYSNVPSSYDPTCYNGSYGVFSDTKIRFDINVMYLNNSAAWNNLNKPWCPVDPNYHLRTLNDQIAQSSQEPTLNVFFTEDEAAFQNIVINQNCPLNNLGFTSVSCSQFPDHDDSNFNQSIHMRNKFLKYYWMMNCVVDNNCQNPEWINDPPTAEEAYSWLSQGRGMAHELVHIFGYGHVSHNYCPYCLDHLMQNQSCSWGNFISPEIIGMMHHALSHTSARKYVPGDTYSNTPIAISENKIWSDNSRIYRGLSVQNGVQFQLTNELIIPSQVDILVKGTSSFTVSGATIHTPNTSSTLDLIVQENSSLTMTNSTIQNCSVSIQSGALTLDNTIIDISNSGAFSIELGSTLNINNGEIQ